MTFFRKYSVLVIGGGIAAVLLIAVLAMMIHFQSGYSTVQSELQSSMQTLERLHQRDPYPSEANVELVNRNLTELENYFQDIMGVLSAGQVAEEDMERAAFPSLREQIARRLYAAAAENQVVAPETMAFGFQRYAMGNLPSQEHVPRLVIQLRTIEALVQLLFRAKIDELISVEREVFDVERVQSEMDGMDGGRRGGRADVVAAPTRAIHPEGVEGLYTRETYRLVFKASDSVMREILNTLARTPMFVAVKVLEAQNEAALGLEGSAAALLASRLKPKAPESAPSSYGGTPGGSDTRVTPLLRHEERVVAGLEKVRVTLELDVYRFEGLQEVSP